jgi:hypothetical protein
MNFSSTFESVMSTATPILGFADISTSTTIGYSSADISTTTTEIPPVDCPVYDKSDDDIIEMFSFW